MMLARNPESAARDSYDVIIVGGGVYGAMLALETTARGLRPLLVERRDFGGGTTFNSFRLIHGGLRYLQSMDIVRLRESVAERRWFLRHYPELVAPVPCLMPLYGRGLRRREAMWVALRMNDLLSIDRNAGVPEARRLPAGRIVSRAETLRMCPWIIADRLEGAALWWDAGMPDSQRLLVELLHWAVACGASVLNYVQAEKLLQAEGRACGIEALDRVTGRRHEYRAPLVLNAAGPWARATAAALDRDHPALFRPTLAWNMLLDRPPPSDTMLAVQAAAADAQTFFVQPFKGRLFLGTGHADWAGDPDQVTPTPGQLERMLEEVNAALPGLNLESREIIRVFPGLLPGRGAQGHELSDRPVVIDHGRRGGPGGLYSVAGVKFTTARRVADRLLRRALGRRGKRRDISAARPQPVPPQVWSCNPGDHRSLEECLPALRSLIEQEAVVHLDDLVLRRCTLWENRRLFPALAEPLCGLFPWDEARRRSELERLAGGFGAVLGSAAVTAAHKA